MSNNTRLAELMNYITIDTTSGTQLQVSGSVKQSSVTSALLKANSTGVLVAATAGTDYLTSVGISNLTATGTPSSTTYLRGDNTWATLIIGGTLPAGGTAGQLLSKIDGTDYNTTWIDNFAPQVKHDVKLGATIAKGKAVYVSTSDGTNMVVSAASNASEATSSKVLGLLETGGVTNDIVKVVTEGLVAGLDTSTATAGDPVWLGTGGNLIFGLVNKPVAPAHLVFIGTVTRVQSNNGEIFVNVQNGFEFEELHNLLITSKVDKDLVYWDNATSLWKNAQLSAVIGYTPYNATNPSNYIALTALSSSATGLTYTNTTGVFSLTSGYVIPTTTSATNWDTAYGWGNHASAGYLTTSSASSTYQPLDADLTAIAALSGTSGLLKKTAANTWSLDINTYLTGITSSDVTTALGYTPVTNARTLTINGTAYDLSADRSWTITSMIYPSAGIAVSTGSAWGTSITDNSTNWNTAYTNRITSLTTTGSSGAATLTSNTLNIPNYTLSGLGGQAALNGTGFVKISGTTISYDNSTYLTSYTETSTLANVTARGATTNSSITVNGYITVTGAGTSSSIYMSDSDNGQREMHCNSDRIGFLTQAGGWGSYCNDDGSWVSVSDITAYSDERIKENIETVDNALEKTLNLRGVYYNRTDIADKSRKLGVIAQEIQKVIPEIVHEEADGLLGVSYGNMVGLFIEAFKELNAKVISQDIQIAELKKLLNK